MRLHHLAYLLTALLLVATSYLAWQGQRAALEAQAKVAQLQDAKSADEAANPAPEALIPVPMPQAKPKVTPLAQPAPTTATGSTPSPALPPPATPPAAPPAAPARSPVPAPGALAQSTPQTSELPGGGLTSVKVQAIMDNARGGGMPSATQLTPRQRGIIAAKPMAKIKALVSDQGFVVLDAGTAAGLKKGQQLAIRRGGSVLGRLRISDTLEAKEAVADLDLASVPPGVSLEVGDEIIEWTEP